MRRLRRTLAWLVAGALVLGSIGMGVRASTICADAGNGVGVAESRSAGECENCGDQGQGPPGCSTLVCTAACAMGPPAMPARQAAVPRGPPAMAAIVHALQGDAPQARLIRPDPPPPR